MCVCVCVKTVKICDQMVVANDTNHGSSGIQDISARISYSCRRPAISKSIIVACIGTEAFNNLEP